MAVYAIGDVQGCYEPLIQLLDRIRFDPREDTLWFTGDLVNRGPRSIDVLRYIKGLRSSVVVLGNHDLHMLAVASGDSPLKKNDTFNDVLDAEDRDEILDWLRKQPLLHHDATLGCTLVHAGMLPQWDLQMALMLAQEAGQLIANSDNNHLFQHMYGDTPNHWEDRLAGWSRVRVIINAFTRLRYCDVDGRMDLRPKMVPGQQPAGLMPWFRVPGRRNSQLKLVFGHWSTLGLLNEPGLIAIDTGCLWGGKLTAVRLDGDGACFQVPCQQMLKPKQQPVRGT